MTSPSPPPSQDPSSKLQIAQIGKWGEQLVMQWLQQQGWTVLAQRWSCRWGEIDIIAQLPTSTESQSGGLAFVEVKTRHPQSWDAHGRLAITWQKQRKLWKTAQFFLGHQTHLADLPCRFDVALVQCSQFKPRPYASAINPSLWPDVPSIELGSPIQIGSYQLTLLDYLESAFTL
ncbi:MAG: YraN family protein [Acaryochloris sp. RU_4_1]|nr:YraN family protein [Acaryochloris sp. RU_4_1]NJR56273.1 YraN family protein [Acaryochloris sp. CRU_2_0]